MRNPIKAMKAIAGELIRNGRQSLSVASHHAERLAAIEERLANNNNALERVLASLGEVATSVSQLDDGGGRAVAASAPGGDDQRVYFGLNDLDRTLETYLDRDGGYFVELGANDGVAQSNTLHFERYRGWRGILVEPTPHNFLQCLSNRSEQTHTFCCACTSFEYRERFVEIAFSNLMSTPVGLESDVPDPVGHAELGREFLAPSDRVFAFGAIARPLNDLLIEAAAPATIDLLSLDVEGAEIEVLKGIDHARFRFRFICIESRNIDRITAYLGPLGYALVTKLTHHDYLLRDMRDPDQGGKFAT